MSSFVVRGAAAVEAMLGSGRVGAGGWSGLGNGGGVAAVVGLGALPVLLGLRSSGESFASEYSIPKYIRITFQILSYIVRPKLKFILLVNKFIII
jgi:hypothetical protein